MLNKQHTEQEEEDEDDEENLKVSNDEKKAILEYLNEVF